jgi:oxepin-CoA hydrolase / 3-oxo-5,6-dehydrosuberyl-CoA semialdehyde dehydrogenase
MIQLQNYAMGQWQDAGTKETLYNAITGEALFASGSENIDFDAMMQYARNVGNKNLRALTYLKFI